MTETPNQKILEHNVMELTEQLYETYHRIKELTEKVDQLSNTLTDTQAERDALQDVVNALAEEASEQFRRD